MVWKSQEKKKRLTLHHQLSSSVAQMSLSVRYSMLMSPPEYLRMVSLCLVMPTYPRWHGTVSCGWRGGWDQSWLANTCLATCSACSLCATMAPRQCSALELRTWTREFVCQEAECLETS